METKGYIEELDIQKYLQVIKRRWLIILGVVLVTSGLSSVAAFMRKPVYQASGLVLLRSDRTSSLTKVGEKIGDIESIMREGNPLQTQAMVLKSQPILKEAINKLELKDKKGNPIEPEALNIKVETAVGTDILKVSNTSQNPQLAASIVNEVMKSYVENNVQSNRTQVIAAGEFIKKQLPYSQAELERASEALRQFKIRYKIIELPQEAGAAISNIAQIDAQINQARAALAEVSAQEAQIRSQLDFAGSKTVEITSLSQIPGVQSVLGELQKVQSQLASDRARYTETHPSVTFLKNQEATLNSLLQERINQTLGAKGKELVLGTQKNVSPNKLQMGEIKTSLASQYVQLEAQRQGLESKLRALSELRVSFKERLDILPNLEKKQGDLDRRLAIAQKNYENLRTRLQEIEVAERQTTGNAKIIEPAEVPKKPAPNKIILVLLGGGVFVGLLLGVAAAFFVDLIDSSLKTVKEAEAFFGYTMLGIIPKFDTNNTSNPVNLMGERVSKRVIVATSPYSVIHEAYQMLQANLKFISHKKVRTIVVTSSVPQEGKSEVSANLAAVLAAAGKQVLLVDADLCHPAQHHLWGLINSVGLSNIIVGHDEFSYSLQAVTKNLSVMTAGVQPPNPLALIDSERMSSLIEMFSQRFDYIVFDTPPLVGRADGAILGKMADGVLLVVRPGIVDSASATTAKSLLERSEANILGIVVNGVNMKIKPNNYFYYSHPPMGQDVVDTPKQNERWVYK
ncbi:GumC family protein [Iningainema tapete]|uniref:Polysaccharide biosynthesis tyrosine autokinase n=1 Tax=Iningainema tapete BLCC-T55 TaxID=2748662 RepID=A0A8J7C0N6_9CYAN|nr:polysaccharide biosynthesis tyrosine autokinase [Iningainema tapete]MBD2778383.1 polysaccharide biosynthesis tyrosine autokinase [Iningainema tapete BLCC-T55]